MFCLVSQENVSNFITQKFDKKVKNVIFESSGIFFFELKVDLKPFSRIFLLMILGYLNSFARFGPWI